MVNQLAISRATAAAASAKSNIVPALAAAAGARASYRFFEFFTAQIRNSDTPRAYPRGAKKPSIGCQPKAKSDSGEGGKRAHGVH